MKLTIFFIIVGLVILMLSWALGESMIDKIKCYAKKRKSN